MPETDDLRWLQDAANELNNLIQVIGESTRALEENSGMDPASLKYCAFIRSGLNRATKVTSELASRLGGLTVGASITTPPQPLGAPAQTIPETPAASGKFVITNPQGERELVLIIDDDEMIVMLATEMLTHAGYRVVSAHEPFRALEIYKQLRDEIALVILDFTLPIMDGAEVFQELRKIHQNVVVMLSSGFAEQDKVRTMLAGGLRGFLPKPYTEQKLLGQVRTVLDALRSERTGERRVL